MAMKLEFLSNELLFDIFDYMSFGQVLHSFQSLNSHFNQLIFVYLRMARHLDLRFMSFHNFNIFYRSQLPNITNQITSLTVSGGDETTLPIECFCCENLCFRQFSNLQSLLLYHIHSQVTMMKLALELDYLPHLIHIKLIDCCLPPGENANQSLIDRIWTVPKLMRFDLSTRSCRKLQQLWPSVISPSVKYVSFQNPTKGECLLPSMLQCTPSLRYLYMNSYFGGEYATLPILPFLVKLELYEGCSLILFSTIRTNELKIFLEKLPNLCHLTIESSKMFMDGYQWENVITNCLPNLKTFRCKMGIDVHTSDNIEARMYALKSSFKSHFWIEDHQWFIRCYLKLQTGCRRYIVYHTLPDIFTPPILFADYIWSLSTCPNENDYSFSDFVHHSLAKMNTVMKTSNRATSSKRSISFCERISNTFRLQWNGRKRLVKTPQTPSLDAGNRSSAWIYAHNLSVELPFEPHFSKSIPKLDQLISLKVLFLAENTNQFDLQVLLDRAPNLRSLDIVCNRMLTSKFILDNIRHSAIRKLGLPDADSLGTGIFYNLQQCVELSRSPLGKQCEILSIGVQNRECTIYLINEMINLQFLTVSTYDNDIPNALSLGERYDLITWLKLTLPSSIKIANYDCCGKHLQLWIR